MSWSVYKRTGTPAAVRAASEQDFNNAAKSYAGKTEEQDVLGAKTAVLSWIDECNCAPNEMISVEASGSRGTTWCTVKIDCSKFVVTI